jgi:hypothetical protein
VVVVVVMVVMMVVLLADVAVAALSGRARVGARLDERAAAAAGAVPARVPVCCL